MIVRSYARGEDIVREGDIPSECCLILEGFACRYKLLPTGHGRSWPSTCRAICPTCRASHRGDGPLRGRDDVDPAVFIPHKSLCDLTRAFPRFTARALARHAD